MRTLGGLVPLALAAALAGVASAASANPSGEKAIWDRQEVVCLGQAAVGLGKAEVVAGIAYDAGSKPAHCLLKTTASGLTEWGENHEVRGEWARGMKRFAKGVQAQEKRLRLPLVSTLISVTDTASSITGRVYEGDYQGAVAEGVKEGVKQASTAAGALAGAKLAVLVTAPFGPVVAGVAGVVGAAAGAGATAVGYDAYVSDWVGDLVEADRKTKKEYADDVKESLRTFPEREALRLEGDAVADPPSIWSPGSGTTRRLTVTATRVRGSAFRLKVDVPSSGTAERSFRWDLGDPTSTQTVPTSTPAVYHEYGAPGRYEARVVVLERGRPTVEATGTLTVPSALQITVINGASNRPLGSATVLLQYDGQTRSWGTDPSGVGRVDDLPARKVEFSIKVLADGFETFTRTSEIDLSRELVAARIVRLTPITKTSAAPGRWPSSTAPPPPTQPPASRPTSPPVPAGTQTPAAPPAAPQYDDAAGLAAWRADYEAKGNKSGTDEICSWSYRLEWVVAPFIKDGDVLGAYVKYITKRYPDGRPTRTDPEVYFGDANAPQRMTSVAAIREGYPQF